MTGESLLLAQLKTRSFMLAGGELEIFWLTWPASRPWPGWHAKASLCFFSAGGGFSTK